MKEYINISRKEKKRGVQLGPTMVWEKVSSVAARTEIQKEKGKKNQCGKKQIVIISLKTWKIQNIHEILIEPSVSIWDA